MAAPSVEKLICDQFNLEALTVNQVKSFKALADGKDVFIGTKTGSGMFAYISSITCAPCKTSSDWIRVLVAVTNEILKRESSKCILDPPRVPLVEQILLLLPEHLHSPADFSGVRVARTFIFCVVFCRSLFVLLFLFYFGHCVVCPSIYGF